MSRLLPSWSFVYRNASIRTDDTAVGTADAGFRVAHVGIVVPLVVDISGVQRQAMCRTGYHAEVASLAALLVDHHRPLYLSFHVRVVFVFYQVCCTYKYSDRSCNYLS